MQPWFPIDLAAVLKSLEETWETSPRYVELPEDLKLPGGHPPPVATPKGMLINAIIQTASFRYGEQWRCAHELLAERGVDARRCIMTGLDHGEDVHIDLWLPDRTYVSVDFEESQAGKDLVAIQSWDAWSATPETDGKTPSLLESLEDQWVIRALLRSEMISVFDRHVHEEHLTHRFETLLLTHRI